MPRCQKLKTENRSNIETNSIKTFKKIILKKAPDKALNKGTTQAPSLGLKEPPPSKKEEHGQEGRSTP